jgi:hypothetical protein
MLLTGDHIDALEYPLTTDEVTARLGEHELNCPGTATVGEALEPLAGETFETAEDVRFAVMTGVDERAIGRKGYSDRDPGAPGEDGPVPKSF